MRIAVIGLRGFPGVQGGVEMHCEHIYTRMPSDVQVRVYRRKPFLTPLSHSTPASNIEFIDLPSTRIKGLEAVLHTLLSCLHIILHRPDVVHVHNIGPGMFVPLLKLFGLKVVLTYHSPNYEHDKWNGFAKWVLRTSEMLAVGFANRLIFVNKFQMQKFSRKVQNKSKYIVNGVDELTPTSDTSFLQRHNIEPGKYLLGVARITPEKGFEYLVQAANRLDWVKQVVIAGASDHDLEYLEKLKSLDTNNKVIFTGFASGEDLRQLYSHAAMYVLSSVTEGFPLVLLEAMSYTLPIVATDIPATHLVHLPQECYVETGDVESLATGITRVAKTAQNGVRPRYDLSRFRWQNIAESTLAVLRKACNS